MRTLGKKLISVPILSAAADAGKPFADANGFKGVRPRVEESRGRGVTLTCECCGKELKSSGILSRVK